jgi:hypothetical protein
MLVIENNLIFFVSLAPLAAARLHDARSKRTAAAAPLAKKTLGKCVREV